MIAFARSCFVASLALAAALVGSPSHNVQARSPGDGGTVQICAPCPDGMLECPDGCCVFPDSEYLADAHLAEHLLLACREAAWANFSQEFNESDDPELQRLAADSLFNQLEGCRIEGDRALRKAVLALCNRAHGG